jgi:Penicillin-insensitive murein endopeptidase
MYHSIDGDSSSIATCEDQQVSCRAKAMHATGRVRLLFQAKGLSLHARTRVRLVRAPDAGNPPMHFALRGRRGRDYQHHAEQSRAVAPRLMPDDTNTIEPWPSQYDAPCKVRDLARPRQNLGRTRWRVAVVRSLCLGGVLTLLACFGRGGAWAQDTAAKEAPRRAMVIAQLPSDAAKVLFGRESTPTAGPPQAIGSYERGCLSGAIALPADGPNWQVMRPSRNRAWGHPVIAFLEGLAQKLPGEAGWPGLLVGDIAQPRGGPMLTGHGSH